YNIIAVIHIKGKFNCLPDYMSRHPLEFNDPDMIDPNYGLEVTSQELKDRLVQLSHSQRKKQLPYIPVYMIKDLLRAAHDDPVSSHFGFHRTYLKLKHQCWWPNMKSSIEKYIKSCPKCQQFNISRQKKPGLLHPITSPDGPFQMIAIDYVGPLPRTPSENRYVFAITDMFTRWVTAVALPSCTAQVTAEALFKHYICRYGVPVSILSDNGTHFRNQLLQSLEYKIGINHIFRLHIIHSLMELLKDLTQHLSHKQ
ncbi:unnamed protein product, partial [Didymodactylos carnosus]